MSIENVSDTARWVAVYRAMESERPDALFSDPYARRLAGRRGEEIVDSMRGGRAMAAPMIVRTAVFDEMILSAVYERQVDTVLNLAAGLDARAWRLKLPAELRWVDVDLPEILRYKTELLRDEKTACRYEAVATDMTDADARRALFARLGAESTTVFVVSEGLLIYLSPQQVGDLAQDLAAQRSFRLWLIDLGSPFLLWMMNRMWGGAVKKGKASFKFAPREGTGFFCRYGWREAEFHSGGDEAHRLNREVGGTWLWRSIARLVGPTRREKMRRVSGFVLLERIEGLSTAPAKETGHYLIPSG